MKSRGEGAPLSPISENRKNFYAIGAAHKQLNTQLLFQIGQRFADGLLADKTSFGGAAKAVLLTDGKKKLKLLVLHKMVTLLTTTICNGVKIN